MSTEGFVSRATDTPPTPSRELRRLEPLIGEWTAVDRSHPGPGGVAAPVDLYESFQWLPGRLRPGELCRQVRRVPGLLRRHVLGLR